MLQVPLATFFEPGSTVDRQRSPDSLELIRLFGSIRDPGLRRRILTLVQEAASRDDSAE
ncbi:hypothetical protein [Methylobacterium trifolii]|nr:hypothetical protein [Methylobacterium trifolii]